MVCPGGIIVPVAKTSLVRKHYPKQLKYYPKRSIQYRDTVNKTKTTNALSETPYTVAQISETLFLVQVLSAPPHPEEPQRSARSHSAIQLASAGYVFRDLKGVRRLLLVFSDVSFL